MKLHMKALIICITLLVLILVFTRPEQVPSVFLMAPFVLMFIAVSIIFASIISWGRGTPLPKDFRKGALIAALPVLLLVLKSLGQLTVRDTLTVAILFIVTYFYLTKISAPAT